MLGVFEIHEPNTVEEASSLLAQHGFDATVYAGGTELLVVMKEGLAHFPHLVNIKTIPDLDNVSVDQGFLRIGPLATHWQLERSSLIREQAPLLAEVESMVANIRVRAAGTIGGNLCFAEPHSDPATLLMAWGATLELSSTNGKRDIPIEEFLLGLFETARQEDEILTGISLPLLPDGMAGGFQKFTSHERPTASVAALLQIIDGAIEDARIAIGSVGPVPMRVLAGEDILRGEIPDEAVFGAAAEQASLAADPVDDIYGSAEYKRNLVRVLTIRALSAATNRARGGNNGR
jgi:carbon-monoxide dehydrogenase medium subunit